MKVYVLCDSYLVIVLGVLNNYAIPGYLTRIKPYPKHVGTLPYYVAIINGILPYPL